MVNTGHWLGALLVGLGINLGVVWCLIVLDRPAP